MADNFQNGTSSGENLKHMQVTTESKFNGMHSSQSSRNHSPATTRSQMPSVQLSKKSLGILTSHSSALCSSPVKSVTQKVSHLTVNDPLQTNHSSATDHQITDNSSNNALTSLETSENYSCCDQKKSAPDENQQHYGAYKTDQSGSQNIITKIKSSVDQDPYLNIYQPVVPYSYVMPQNPFSHNLVSTNTSMSVTQSNSSHNFSEAHQKYLPNLPRQNITQSCMPKLIENSGQSSSASQNPINQSTITAQDSCLSPNYNQSYPLYQVPQTIQKDDINESQQKSYTVSSKYPLKKKILPNQSMNASYNQQQQYTQHQLTPQQHNITSFQGIVPQNNYSSYQPVVASLGFNKLWGNETYDLLQIANILPHSKVQPPRIHLGQEVLDGANCSPDIFRCTLNKIPETNTLLQKSRLPLGILIHPFKDLSHLAVIQCNVIVRCRACRTYINPFVYFVDNKRWKCNLCYRINELPEEFQYDPVSKTYGDPSRRPEVRSSTIEYIAPGEYMLRPPQPAVYLFLLDISQSAVESGYLPIVCATLLEEIKTLPGDARTQIGFLAYDSYLHFFSLAEGLNRPHEMTVLEIDDVFLPCPDNLLVNLKDHMEMVIDLLKYLPTRYINSYDNNSALGAALQVAHKMMAPTGGRVTVFQSTLPNVGPGALSNRETLSHKSSLDSSLLNPAHDFYKRLSLDCSAQQIAVDLFVITSQFVDLATISGISRFSGGCIFHFPQSHGTKNIQNEALQRCFRRYLTRKIGFEAVMRIRCTRGISIHTFHGNFFVRSTDLLSLPNVNPDAAYGMQICIDESLSELQTVCFQAAVLYTSSRGERRIRVHTLCLPVTSLLHEVINSADQQCIIGLLTKMAVDRSMQSSLSDAREAFINVAVDILSTYKMSLNLGSAQSGLLVSESLKLLPLYISALLKFIAFRSAVTRLDDRMKAMLDIKTKPLHLLMPQIYPDLYPIHNLEQYDIIMNSEEEPVPRPPHLQLTARCLERTGAFLMDTSEHMFIYVCSGISEVFLTQALGVASFNDLMDNLCEIPILDNPINKRLHLFINYLNDEKPFIATLQIIKDNSANRLLFLEKLIEDRQENSLSYHEFLQHVRSQMK